MSIYKLGLNRGFQIKRIQIKVKGGQVATPQISGGKMGPTREHPGRIQVCT